ncbi:MAG: ATP-binding protein [Thermodesulfovibrionales bacterium]
MTGKKYRLNPSFFRQQRVIALVLWTLLTIFLLGYESYEHWQENRATVLNEARAAFVKDILYRRWSAMHGGVYVPVTKETPPNPLLAHLPERDLTTHSGKRLTLMNPAYMSRQVNELSAGETGMITHITSLRPLRPENSPDTWETAALQEFEKGRQEVTSFEKIGGKDYLRFMRPLKTEDACLECHAGQGYQIGNIRGGISVAIPLTLHQASFFRSLRDEIKVYAIIWLAGVAFIFIGSRQIVRQTTALRVLNETLRGILDHAPFGIYVVEADGKVSYTNPGMIRMSGSTFEQFISANLLELPPYREKGISDMIRKGLRGEYAALSDVEYTSYFGGKATFRNFSCIPLSGDGRGKALVIVEDITERRQAAEEQKKLEGQLLQAQKIESIGRLAGGVAHDFNNILSAILGYSELALLKLSEDSPAREEIGQVKAAGERAASLTHQLLAFSRKQVLEMKPANVNDIAENTLKMLNRLIRADIVLELKLKKPLRNIRADQTQIGQVLMNLVVNAVDAMPDGGSLMISTDEVLLDEAYVRQRKEVKPGPYVIFTVTDTGAGMSREVRERIFEPFFTTKDFGKGTGLGLAMVYGIVKQHGGYIYVYSEPGKGTAFKVYLPVISEDISSADEAAAEGPMKGGSETVLVVDDDPFIRRLIADVLGPLGYRVLEADGGEEALKISESRTDAIDLLLTDIIMPKMNGKVISELVSKRHPEAKTIFMSGYTDDVIAHHGMLEPGLQFIQKPIVPRTLSDKLREVLDRQP